MPRSLRVCPVPGCPQLTRTGRCTEHRREADRARGTRQQRGYDADHLRLRNRLAPIVATGTVACRSDRCLEEEAGRGRLIRTGQAWDLGHTDNRTGYRGPEHEACNRAAGGRAAHTA